MSEGEFSLSVQLASYPGFPSSPASFPRRPTHLPCFESAESVPILDTGILRCLRVKKLITAGLLICIVHDGVIFCAKINEVPFLSPKKVPKNQASEFERG
jgi:hypothetical protein